MTLCTCLNQMLPHDPMGSCPAPFYGMPQAEWEAYGVPTREYHDRELEELREDYAAHPYAEELHLGGES